MSVLFPGETLVSNQSTKKKMLISLHIEMLTEHTFQ